MITGNASKNSKLKRATAWWSRMYYALLILSFTTIAPLRESRAEGADSTVFDTLVVAPVAIGLLAGDSFYNWMFGDPKPIVTGGGYGMCPFLSDLKNSAFDCQNLNSTAPPWSTASLPQPGQGVDNGITDPQQPCAFYRRLLACQKGCSEMDKNRIIGYYQTCSGMTQLASPSAIPDHAIYGLGRDGGDLMTACSLNKNFRDYANNMRSCLQVGAAASLKSCKECSSVVEGIIHAHTPCNANTGFCTTLSEDPQALSCFGAGIGASWQGIGGGHSLSGPARSVGICHMMEQALTCASKTNFQNWWTNLCKGYQKGCEMSGGVNCKLSCPAYEDLGPLIQGSFATLIESVATASTSELPGIISLAEEACHNALGYEPNF